MNRSEPQPIRHVIDQHSEEAAFLWLLRDAAVHAPHYSLQDLAQLDGRVEAHLDGLRIAGAAGWETCATALAHEESGEVFCAAVLALESGEPEKMRQVYDAVAAAPEARRGLVSAFGWVDRAWWRGELRDLLHSQEAYQRRIGLAAAATHRADPGPVLAESLQAEDLDLRATALRVASSMGRADLLPAVQASLHGDDATVRLCAAWSAMLLGDRTDAPREALAFVWAEPPRLVQPAPEAALRALPHDEALAALNQLARRPRTLRNAVVACGIIGDPVCMPWLFEQMSIPEVARVAGESFAMITGVDLAYEDLEGEWPEGFEAGPTENAKDGDVAMDSDEDLSWPDVRLLTDWWSRNQNRFPSGMRYLLGKPVAGEHLEWVLRHGMQRQREAAALELKLLRPGVSLFETRAPGLRQQRVLGLKP